MIEFLGENWSDKMVREKKLDFDPENDVRKKVKSRNWEHVWLDVFKSKFSPFDLEKEMLKKYGYDEMLGLKEYCARTKSKECLKILESKKKLV